MKHIAWKFLALAVLPASGWAAAPGADRCSALAGRMLGDARVESAMPVAPAPEWKIAGSAGAASVHQPFCRVFARIAGRVGFELWLPEAAAWNGRLLGAGVGGSAGTYNFPLLARGLERGFATVSTDTGHLESQHEWMLDAIAAEDYAHRGVHWMTQAAKALLVEYYGKPARYAYFEGCSGGGRSALKELQKYPADYDGILAGAPGPDMPRLSVRHMLAGLWQQQAGVTVADSDWQLVQAQALRACDALDGLADGVVEDPRRCHVDLDALACAPGQASGCMAPAQLAVAKRIIAPISDQQGRLVDGGLLPGVRSRPGPPPPLVMELFGQGVHHDLAWQAQAFEAGRDLAAAYAEQPELRADNPDVAAFARRGGKLLLYQGWMDPSVIAQQTLDYHAALVARSGSREHADEFARLYMVPGMLHCRGGNATDRFGGEAGSYAEDAGHDMLAALVAWREQGRPPAAIVAARVADGTVTRTRPLCPYPQLARYRGSGSPEEAASFSCLSPDERRE